MELSPSDDVHAAADDVRCSAPSADGTSEVPGTPVHASSDCRMTPSISSTCPVKVWSTVRIVAGLLPSDVLHCRLIAPGVETSNRVNFGHEVPPDRDAACRMSPTSVPSV